MRIVRHQGEPGILPMILRSAIALPVLAALLAACANFSAISTGSPEEQVRARVGAPDTVWKNADGSETWEYPLGPFGTETYMITIGPDHTVGNVSQVLSDEFLFKVQTGMSREEVRRLLGRPTEIDRFERRNEEVWSWRFMEKNVWHKLFNAHFDPDTGVVRAVSRTEDPLFNPGGGRRH
ncbi:MAG: outer membrane protein assembly factor BamE [Burkholderiales bacterium]